MEKCCFHKIVLFGHTDFKFFQNIKSKYGGMGMKPFREKVRGAIQKAALSAAVLSALLFGAVGWYADRIPQQFFVTPGKELRFSSMEMLQSGAPVSYDQTSLAGKSIGASQTVTVRLFGIIPVTQTHVSVTDRKYVSAGGMLFGIKLFTEGVMVVDTGSVETEAGTVSPAADAGIQKGDIILSVDGQSVSSNESLAAVLAEDSAPVSISFRREEKLCRTILTPAKSKIDGSYKGGLWVRDSTAGLGTITYYDAKTGAFAGLGHGISDSDTGQLMPLSDGQICRVRLNGIIKGQSGAPGELSGSFASNEVYGSLYKNGETGVFGELHSDFLTPQEAIPVLNKQEVKTGDAIIRCTLDDGGIKEYKIRIDKIDLNEQAITKNLVLTVTDPELLEKTGGIVQGMSGSPILQDGKLVGAVTHVFVSNPTKGYGIFAENMLKTAE